MSISRPATLVLPAAAIDTNTLVNSAGVIGVKAAGIDRTRLAGAFSKVTVQAGEDETVTNQITCATMAAGDEVVAVVVLTTAASIATAAAHAGTLTAAAGKITPGTKVNNTGNLYLIFWNDLT